MTRQTLLILACSIFCAVFLTGPAGLAAQTVAQDFERFAPFILDRQDCLCYLEVDGKNGWFAKDIGDRKSLKELYKRFARTADSLIIPVFPTVYSPGINLETDKPYFDAILRLAGIRTNAKVLVAGSGSGADAWAAWLRSKTKVYAVDINPMAVANTRATAKIGGFPVEAVIADITKPGLPSDFSGFDFVLWNMPMLNPAMTFMTEPGRLLHDGDNGQLFDAFMVVLPALLKKSGKAVLWNSIEAMDRIKYPKKVYAHGRLAVCILSN